jgi:HAD superfamily hydrolase (TIGR01509 family)
MMSLSFVPTAVLFDMDGLMIDSERAGLDCWRQASAEFDMDFDETFLHRMVGLHERLCRELVEQTYPDRDLTAMFHRTNELYVASIDAGLPLKPGILPLLQWLEEIGLPKAVATSTRRQTAELNLERTGLRRFFDVIVTGSDVEHPKPAPDIYLKAAAHLGVQPGQCLVLEDSEPGVRAALAAGMTPVQIPDMKQPSAEFLALGHRVVDSLPTAHALLRETLKASQSS